MIILRNVGDEVFSTDNNWIELINTIKSSVKPAIDSLSESDSIQVAVIGRPNSGKSTFINSVTKDNRVIVSNTPGTTIDN